jgi:glycosyltransferase involved in cell wall biosynthesis
MKISIGVPVKNEVDNIQLLGRQLSSLLDAQKYQHLEFEILVNENNSIDGSESAILEWQKNDSRVVMFNLREQLEFQSSIQDLMRKSTGDAFCLIQSDLQDPVEVLERMIDAWLQQSDYLIVGQIIRRKERNLVNLGRKAFYSLLDSSSDGVYRDGIQDFYVLPQFIYTKIANLPRINLFIRGYLIFNYSKIVYIKYERDERKYGKSKFRFVDMYELALDGLLLHGKRFVRILSVFSFMIFFFTFVGIVLLLVASLVGFESGSKGWTSLILAISFTVSFLGLAFGVTLEYLIRIYRRLLLER